jgi:hypothetical protein
VPVNGTFLYLYFTLDFPNVMRAEKTPQPLEAPIFPADFRHRADIFFVFFCPAWPRMRFNVSNDKVSEDNLPANNLSEDNLSANILSHRNLDHAPVSPPADFCISSMRLLIASGLCRSCHSLRLLSRQARMIALFLVSGKNLLACSKALASGRKSR